MNNGHQYAAETRPLCKRALILSLSTRIDARAERGRHRALRFRNRRQGPTVHFGVLAINPTSTHCSVAFRIVSADQYYIGEPLTDWYWQIEANGRMHVRTLAIPVRPILDNCRPDEVPLE